MNFSVCPYVLEHLQFRIQRSRETIVKNHRSWYEGEIQTIYLLFLYCFPRPTVPQFPLRFHNYFLLCSNFYLYTCLATSKNTVRKNCNSNRTLKFSVSILLSISLSPLLIFYLPLVFLSSWIHLLSMSTYIYFLKLINL